MALLFGQLRCQAPVCASGHSVARSSVQPRRNLGANICPSLIKGLHAQRLSLQVHATDQVTQQEVGPIRLAIPAQEVLQTIKFAQREDGKLIVEDIIEGSTAAQSQVKIGSVLSAVSDPAAPGAMWQLEPRSSIRHVLDQMRMVQSSTVQLEILPPSAAEQEADGRTGFDKGRGDTQQVQWNQRVDEKTMQRRQQQREAYLSKEGTTNTTNWLALAFGLVLVPAGAILLYAIQSGFLDEMNAGWRAGF